MQLPYYDPRKEQDAVVGSIACPVCDFRGREATAEIINGGGLRCPKCGSIRVGYCLMSRKVFKPTSLIRQLVQVATPVLDYLGAGDPEDEYWQFIQLGSTSQSFEVFHKLDDCRVQIRFSVLYESDCQVARRTDATSKNHAGLAWDQQRFERERCRGRVLPTELAAFIKKLVSDGYQMLGDYYLQHWGKLRLVKGDWHSEPIVGGRPRGVFLNVAWL